MSSHRQRRRILSPATQLQGIAAQAPAVGPIDPRRLMNTSLRETMQPEEQAYEQQDDAIAYQARQDQREQDRNAARTEAAAATAARKADTERSQMLSFAEKRGFEAQGIPSELDSTGKRSPERDPLTGQPKQTNLQGPVEYDPTGKAYQMKREGGKWAQEYPDAKADIGTNPDDPTDPYLYRKNKQKPWDTIDPSEALLSDDPAVKSAAARHALVSDRRGLEKEERTIRAELTHPDYKIDKTRLKDALGRSSAGAATPEDKAILAKSDDLTKKQSRLAEINVKAAALMDARPDDYAREKLATMDPATVEAGYAKFHAERSQSVAALRSRVDEEEAALNQEMEAFAPRTKGVRLQDLAAVQEEQARLHLRRQMLDTKKATVNKEVAGLEAFHKQLTDRAAAKVATDAVGVPQTGAKPPEKVAPSVTFDQALSEAQSGTTPWVKTMANERQRLENVKADGSMPETAKVMEQWQRQFESLDPEKDPAHANALQTAARTASQEIAAASEKDMASKSAMRKEAETAYANVTSPALDSEVGFTNEETGKFELFVTPEDRAKADEHAKANFIGKYEGEKATFTPWGDLNVNPTLIFRPDQYTAAVDEAQAPAMAKERAMQALPAQQQTAVEPVWMGFLQATGTQNAFLKSVQQTSKRMGIPITRYSDPALKVLAVQDFMQSPDFSPNWNQIALGVSRGLDQLQQSAAGIGSFFGSAGAQQYGEGLIKQQENASSAAQVGGGSDLLGQVASGATSLIPGIGAGVLSGGAGFGVQGALATSAVTAGAQSGGSTMVEARKAGMSQSGAMGVAALSGLITGTVTRLGGATGTEAVFKKLFAEKATMEAIRPAFKALLLEKVRGYGIEGLKETLEEVPDQLLQNVLASATYKPGQDITEGLLDTAVVSFILGGGVNAATDVAKSAGERFNPDKMIREQAARMEFGRVIAAEKTPEVIAATLAGSPMEAQTPEVLEKVTAIDARIADGQQQLASATTKAGKLYSTRQLAQAYGERAAAVKEITDSVRDSYLAAAVEEIDAAQPPEEEASFGMSTLPSPAETSFNDDKLRAKALVAIATGQAASLDNRSLALVDLARDDKGAVTAAKGKSTAPDGIPRVSMENGEMVISQATIDRMTGMFPATEPLIGKTESERRAEILTKVATEAAAKATPQKDAPADTTGREKAPEPQESLIPPRGGVAAEAAKIGTKDATFSVEIEGQADPVTIEAPTAKEAETLAFAAYPGRIVRSVSEIAPAPVAEESSAVAPPAPEIAAPQNVTPLSGAGLSPASITKAIAKARPGNASRKQAKRYIQAGRALSSEVDRWKSAFPAGVVALSNSGSGGVQTVVSNGALALDFAALAETLDSVESNSLAWVERAIQEEVIHAVALRLEKDGKIDLAGIFKSLPRDIRGKVRAAYPASNDDLNLGHEFFRMWIQQRIQGKKAKKGQPILTEQTFPAEALAKLKDALTALLRYFRDMAATLRKQKASQETIDRVVAAGDLIEAGVRAMEKPAAPDAARPVKSKTVRLRSRFRPDPEVYPALAAAESLQIAPKPAFSGDSLASYNGAPVQSEYNTRKAKEAVSRLYAAGSTVKPDTAAEAFAEAIGADPQGFTEFDMWEAIRKELDQLDQAQSKEAAEDDRMADQERQAIAFYAAIEDGKVKVEARDLEVGEILVIEGDRVVVKSIDRAPDGRVTGITLQDGKRFGLQEIDATTVLFVESYESNDPDWSVEDLATPESLKGEKIDKEWHAFADDSGSLGIPRDDMPQIKSVHRGALANFLRARGIEWTMQEVLPGTLKPTQAEYSQKKVEKTREFSKENGGLDRAILTSADNYVVDGHHQWLAALTDTPTEPMAIVRLDAPIRDILAQMTEFPSATKADGSSYEKTPVVVNEAPEMSDNASSRQSDDASIQADVFSPMKPDVRETDFVNITPFKKPAIPISAPELEQATPLIQNEPNNETALPTEPGLGRDVPESRDMLLVPEESRPQSQETGTPAPAPEVTKDGQRDMLAGRDDEPFNLTAESAADRRAREAKELEAANKQRKKETDAAKKAMDAATPELLPSLTPEEQALKDVLDSILDGTLQSQAVNPTYSREIPDAAFLPLATAARAFAKVSETPEALAASLTKMGAAYRAFSEAIWSGMGMSNAKLRGITPDWSALYESLDKPATTPDTANQDDLSTRPNLEPDRGDAGTGDGSRQSGFPAEPRTTGGDVGPLEQAGNGSQDPGPGDILPPDGASPTAGARGNRRSRGSSAGTAQRPSGDERPGGSSDVDAYGVEADTRGASEPDSGLVVPGLARTVAQGSGNGIRRLVEIRKSAPSLTPEQAGDVAFIETRLLESGKPGVLLTNGTGTGKTFSGLGVLKRFLDRGAKHILIAVPSDKIGSDWVSTAKQFFGIEDIAQLGDSKDAGGSNRVNVTTYANLGMNNALVGRPWDAVLTDESHHLSSSKDGTDTKALDTFRALTWHPKHGPTNRANMEMADELVEMAELRKKLKSNEGIMNLDDTMDQVVDGLRAENAKMERRHESLMDAYRKRVDELKETASKMPENARPKAVMLSATPFAYHFSLDYAEGYLFEHGEEPQGSAYNTPSARGKFYIENFGYRMRYGKLTQPENAAATGLLERLFAQNLMKSGAMSGRSLQVPFDYSREFVLTENAIGTKVDEVFALIMKDDRLTPLRDKLEIGNYLARRYLLEALKAREAVKRINQHLEMGRKVVVFHDYKKGGSLNPLRLYARGAEVEKAYALLSAEIPGFEALVKALDRLTSPIEVFTAAFPAAGIFNGDVPTKQRRAIVDSFNESGGKMNVALVQRASGKEGISLHDRDAKHQRVFVDLGIPGRPTDSIQSEGRIYRHGVQSDAVVEYLTTGTNFERWTFAQTIAQRASTAENLAMGEQARALLQAFSTGYDEAAPSVPSTAQGKGGKARDAARDSGNPYDNAVALYYTNQKKTSRTKSAEGSDYFATPEPLGFKMVEWAGLRAGEKVLEPSAGHGAIARFFPDFANRHAVEPSFELSGRLALNSPDTAIHRQSFEDFNVANKFDAVVMNPPFGTAGKLAMEHLEKAVKHLRDGGRVIALIPMGSSMSKRFDSWYEEQQGTYMAAEILLPSATFERAGTSVSTRIVILDKTSAVDAPQMVRRDLTDASDPKALFERLKDVSVPPRPGPAVKKTVAESVMESVTEKEAEPAPAKAAGGSDYAPADFLHTKSRQPVFVAKIVKRLTPESYAQAKSRATAHGGYYSSFKGAGAIPGFHFKSAEERDAFLGESFGTIQAQSPASLLKKAGVDTKEADKRTNIALTEVPGQRTIIDPERSLGAGVNSPGDEVIMGISDLYADEVTEESIKQWDAAARAMLDEDYEGTVKKVMNYGFKGGMLSPELTRAAQLITEQEARQPMDAKQQKRLQALVWSYRLAGTEQARGLAARRDPFKTKAERHREAISKAIFMPPAEVRAKIEAAETPAEKQVILQEDTKRIDEIIAALAKMGVTLEDVLNGDRMLVARRRDILKSTIGATMGAKEAAAALDALDGAMSFKDVGAKHGISEDQAARAFEAAKSKFEQEVRKRIAMAAKAQGIKAPVLNSQSPGADPFVEFDFGGIAQLPPVQQELAIQRIMQRMGFFPPSQQGKRRNVFRQPGTVKPAPGGRMSLDDYLKMPMPRDIRGTQIRLPGNMTTVDESIPPGPGKVWTRPARNQDELGLGLNDPVEMSIIVGANLTDVKDVYRLMRITSAAGSNTFDMMREYWINNLLSGPVTQFKNASSNALFGSWNLIASRGMESLLNTVWNNDSSARFGEFKAIWKSIMPAWSRGLRLMALSWDTEDDLFAHEVLNEQISLIETGPAGERRKIAIAGTKGRVIRMPGRMLMAADGFFKGLFGTMEAAAQAHRIAKAEGLKPGTPAWDDRTNELIYKPGSKAWIAAAQQAETNLFQNKLDPNKNPLDSVPQMIGSWGQSKHLPVRFLATILFPFTKTPYNVYREGIRRSPIGSVLLAGQLLKGGMVKMKGGKLSSTVQAQMIRGIAEQIFAWSATALLLGAVEGDDDDWDKKFLITGSAPKERGAKELQERAFGGPYVIKIGNTVIPYGAIEPFATVIGTTADFIRSGKSNGTINEKANAVFHAVKRGAIDKTFLSGVKSMSELLSMDETSGGATMPEKMRRFALQAIVPNVLRQPMRNADSRVPDAATAPWWYDALPLPGAVAGRVNAGSGEQKEKTGNSVSRLLIPSTTTPEKAVHPVDRVLLQWNQESPADAWAPQGFTKSRQLPDGRRVELNGGTLNYLNVRSGTLARKALEGLPLKPVEEDIERIKDAYTDARKQAWDAIKYRPVEQLGTLKED